MNNKLIWAFRVDRVEVKNKKHDAKIVPRGAVKKNHNVHDVTTFADVLLVCPPSDCHNSTGCYTAAISCGAQKAMRTHAQEEPWSLSP
eukprot:5079268-Karenia_brevis.AAC.4